MSRCVSSSANAPSVSSLFTHSVAATTRCVSGAARTDKVHCPRRSVFVVNVFWNLPLSVCVADTEASAIYMSSSSTTIPVRVMVRSGCSFTTQMLLAPLTLIAVSAGALYAVPSLSLSVTRHTSCCPSGISPNDTALRRYTVVPSSSGLSHSTVAIDVRFSPSGETTFAATVCRGFNVPNATSMSSSGMVTFSMRPISSPAREYIYTLYCSSLRSPLNVYICRSVMTYFCRTPELMFTSSMVLFL